MGNSIMDQARALASDGDSRFNQRNSLAEIERLQQEAQNTAAMAQAKQQTHQAVAQYHSSGAEQEKIQGQQLMQQGAAKKSIGMGLIGMGGVMIAMAAIPIAGPGMLAKGMEMIGQGAGQVVMGNVDQSQGQQAMSRYQQKLDLATNHDIISKEESKIVKKEIMRSQIYEMKKALLEDLMAAMQPMLDQMGVDGQEMNEDQLAKWFDKMFEKGAEMLANGGLLETDLTDINGKSMFSDEEGNALKGNFYFMRDEESGDIFQIEVARDADGNALTGALGEPLLNLDDGAKEVQDGELKQYLEAHFMMMDYARTMAMQAGLDPSDLNQATEFADLVHKTNITDIKSGRTPAPLKVIYEDDKVFLQEWNYELDVPVGPKTPADELAGGEYDRGDIESYQLALERSQRAMQTLGLAGGARFNLLMSTASFGLSAEGSDSSNYSGISGRDSGDFANFGSIATTLDLVNSQRDILSGSSGDVTDDGGA